MDIHHKIIYYIQLAVLIGISLLYCQSRTDLRATDDIEETYVRFGFVPEDLRDEGLDDLAWSTCDKDTRGAQPCWQYIQ